VTSQQGQFVPIQLAHVDPVNQYCPDVGTSRQPRMFMHVDLPEPLGPITATNSPARIVRSTPSSARTSLEAGAVYLVDALHLEDGGRGHGS
jgi:hypothetical protein